MRYFWDTFTDELIETADVRYILRLLMSGYVEISRQEYLERSGQAIKNHNERS